MSEQSVNDAMITILNKSIETLRNERAWHLEKIAELEIDLAAFEHQLAELTEELLV